MHSGLQKYADLLKDDHKALAHLATVMPDGSPQVTPVWFDYVDGHVRVNSAKDRVKDRNMRRNPHVALSIVDTANAYRYVALRGRVVEITEHGADAHIDRLAKKYLGKDRYPGHNPKEIRVTYRIAVERVGGMG